MIVRTRQYAEGLAGSPSGTPNYWCPSHSGEGGLGVRPLRRYRFLLRRAAAVVGGGTILATSEAMALQIIRASLAGGAAPELVGSAVGSSEGRGILP